MGVNWPVQGARCWEIRFLLHPHQPALLERPSRETGSEAKIRQTASFLPCHLQTLQVSPSRRCQTSPKLYTSVAEKGPLCSTSNALSEKGIRPRLSPCREDGRGLGQRTSLQRPESRRPAEGSHLTSSPPNWGIPGRWLQALVSLSLRSF